MHFRSLAKNREFRERGFRKLHVRTRQQSCAFELATQERNLFVFVQRRVIGAQSAASEQFRDDRLVHRRVLPQVHRREMETKNLHRAPERQHARVGDHLRAMLGKRIGDHVQVVNQFVRRRVRRGVRVVRLARGAVAREAAIRGGEAAVQPRDRAAIRLVDAKTRVIMRTLGKVVQRWAHVHEAARHRKLRAELVQLREVMRQREFGLCVDHVIERVRVHKRIAVAVAADPHADLQKRRKLRLRAVVRFERSQRVLG